MPSSNTQIRLIDIRYQLNELCILDVPRLEIECAGLTMICGPNGAGKSVLLRIMHGILLPTAGNVSYPKHGAEPRQAMVFQRPVLLRRTVRANVKFALSASARAGEDPAQVLALCGLSDKADRPARSLSGGEQQRLALARALAVRPALLFLDEPTANLDPASTIAIEDIIKDIIQGGTKVVMVTHDVRQAERLAEELVICHNGRVIEQGPASTILENPKSVETGDFLAGRLRP